LPVLRGTRPEALAKSVTKRAGTTEPDRRAHIQDRKV